MSSWLWMRTLRTDVPRMEAGLPDWTRIMTRLTNEIETQADVLRERAGLPPRAPRTLRAATYRGYANGRRAFLSGRVLLEREGRPATENDPWWRNLAGALRRIESDEVPAARVRIELAGVEHTAVTDEEGYFRVWLDLPSPLPAGRSWHEADVTVEPTDGAQPVRATAHVLAPPPTARFGIISDLDDTVIRTDATSLVRMLRATLFENAHTRLPFEGVAAFYRALTDGAARNEGNPVFYVSSSPWNLYELLTEFLEVRGIPLGPVMLRDWGISSTTPLPTAHGPHKRSHIDQILSFYADLPFILIGDSGQEDPEIYRDIVAAHPERVRAIYIRNVARDPLRRTTVEKLAEEVRASGGTMLIAEDTYDAAKHAAEHQWIDPARLAEIARERREDAPPVKVTHAPTVIVQDGDTRLAD